jgi:hypothetical protein
VQKTPPPLVGFNNNVRHHGRIFHIQTEDSGVKRPHVITHLFGDGGRILKSLKTEYSEHVGREDTPATVRRLMKEQHKAMFVALRSGELDAVIEAAFGPAETSAPPTPVAAPAFEPVPPSTPEELASKAAPIVTPLPLEWRALAAPSVSVPDPPPKPRDPPEVGDSSGRNALPPPGPPSTPAPSPEPSPLEELVPRKRAMTPPPVSTSIGSAVEAMAAKAAGIPMPRRSSTPPPLSTPSALQRRKSADAPGRYSASRPASIFQEPEADGRSLFGDPLIGEKSLDEVILSYLAEDLDNPK